MPGWKEEWERGRTASEADMKEQYDTAIEAVEELESRRQEQPDVRRTLLRRAAAVMQDAHRRHIRHARDVVRAQAQVVIFEVEEVARIETAERLQHRRPEQHEHLHRVSRPP